MPAAHQSPRILVAAACCILAHAWIACKSGGPETVVVELDTADGDTQDADASDAHSPHDADEADGSGQDIRAAESVEVIVLLDGAPVEGAIVTQGGTKTIVRTDALGRATLPLDATVFGEVGVVASHPNARIRTEILTKVPEGPVTVALSSFSTRDNELYAFQDPGEPERRPDTRQCGHCHQTLNDDWFDSAHRGSAQNPQLLDLYLGTSSGHGTAEACAGAGGTWINERCVAQDGLLAHLNPDCADDPDCSSAQNFGTCSNCHAPAQGPTLGGQDLRLAEGHAQNYGVFCDVCHRVESVHSAAPEPGVGGRLSLLRPSERSPSPALGAFAPLTFGPSHDSPNPRMGSVQRDHFRDGSLCGGCHELHYSDDELPQTLAERWSQAGIPAQTTYSEWSNSYLNPSTPCPVCHMPPAPDVTNSADLQFYAEATVGIQGGWLREPGDVRHHSWLGPRSAEPDGARNSMLALAAAVSVEKSETATEIEASIEVRNLGAGHALPTGESMRQMLLLVSSQCDGVQIAATGGLAISELGGRSSLVPISALPEVLPNLPVGAHLRFVSVGSEFVDYQGVEPFRREVLSPEERGFQLVQPRGHSTLSLNESGDLVLDEPVPAGTTHVGIIELGWESDFVGAAGVIFARVLIDDGGRRGVPSFLATDVLLDNRLMPGEAFSHVWRFPRRCENQQVRARLVHRAFPAWIAAERGWVQRDSLMTEVVR